MKYPTYLKMNDTIGFVAPSFGCNTEPYKSCFESAMLQLEEIGKHKFDIGPNCYADKGIGISNTPELCGKELTDYYMSDENNALISCGGGEMMCEILDYVDFEKLKEAKPKWFLGYSDNTNFTYLLTTILDTASIYGPCIGAFGMKPWHKAIQDAYDVLTGAKTIVSNYDLWEKESLKSVENPYAPYNATEKNELRAYMLTNGTATKVETDHMIRFEGRLLGGCLDCLDNLVGTVYDKTTEFNEKYKNDGIIWFLEACDLNPMSIRRAVWQLKHAGWFQHVKGFLIGRPLCYGQEFIGLDHYHAYTDLLAEYNVPILMDLDIGHLPPAMPLICGSYAEVTYQNGNLSIDMKLK